MSKKIKIQDKRRAELKRGLKPRTKNERRYVQLVEASRARARNSVRGTDGKYLTREALNQVVRAAAATAPAKGGKGIATTRKTPTGRTVALPIEEIKKAANFTPQELQEFLNNHAKTLEAAGGVTSQHLSAGVVMEKINEYKGKFELNGKPVTKAEAHHAVSLFQQLLASNFDAADVSMRMRLTLKGTMKLTLPTLEQLADLAKAIEDEGADSVADMVNDWLEDNGHDVIVYFSTPKEKAA